VALSKRGLLDAEKFEDVKRTNGHRALAVGLQVLARGDAGKYGHHPHSYQNPMDLEYRALGNAGLWCVGRLQMDADMERVLDGLENGGENGGYSGWGTWHGWMDAI
jgi:hypothetical protein